VQTYAHIIRGEPEFIGDPRPRLFVEKGAPEDLGVLGLERRQRVMDARTCSSFLIRFNSVGGYLQLAFIGCLAPLARRAPAVVIDQRVAQDPAEPGIDHIAVIRRLSGTDYLEAEVLERILGILRPSETAAEVAQKIPPALDQSSIYSVRGESGGMW
jgi:hypothetical protein